MAEFSSDEMKHAEELQDLLNTYRANLTAGKRPKYNLQYVVFQDLESLLLLIACESKYIDALRLGTC